MQESEFKRSLDIHSFVCRLLNESVMSEPNKELSEAFDAAKDASEPLERPSEPQPFVSRFGAKGVPSLDNAENITPQFENAKEATRSLEEPAQPEPFASRFEAKGVPSLDEKENITPDFNSTASNQNDKREMSTESDGRNSEMVEKDKSSLELKPSDNDRDRKAVDRKAHLEDMAKEDKEARLEMLLKMADQIAKDKEMEPELDRDMGMSR